MYSDSASDNRLEHSCEAITVTAQFYNKQIMVYVEGPDDVPFWDALFSRVVSQDFYEISSVNGKENLVPFIVGIENGSIKNAFVATDLDYCLFSERGRSICSYIIYTYGHSIENTMFCPKSVATYIRRALRKTDNYLDVVNQIYDKLLSATRPLLAMDILNSIDLDCNYHTSNGNNSLLGRGYYYYQAQKEKIDISSEKIEKEVIAHSDFDANILQLIEKDIDRQCASRSPRHLFQGHFIGDAMMHLIRVTLKENNLKSFLSNEALYNSFFDCIDQCNPLCHDKQHVINYIEKAINEYNRSRDAA